MKKMTNKAWSAMSDKDKFLFLKSGKKKLCSAVGLDPNAKVNSDSPCIKVYWIEVGGVVISHKLKSESEAYADADINIEKWNS